LLAALVSTRLPLPV